MQFGKKNIKYVYLIDDLSSLEIQRITLEVSECEREEYSYHKTLNEANMYQI